MPELNSSKGCPECRSVTPTCVQEHEYHLRRQAPTVGGEGMEAVEEHNVEVVRRYFDRCKNGELDDSSPTLADDVVHYFLPQSYDTIRGSEHLAVLAVVQADTRPNLGD